ncbi:MAG TPA: ABC transporter permease [Candidatus Borkfalkia faecipullorum]|uniref:ABC transporter permease n=1 Tax=Candidatus Borkfalkia faecipullorum TaxID=2838510 RepID=A0A9D1V6L5_9FIRM|nr:ABC transporter permease [Candidatus Borkfalkia faecipullorum]
MKNAFIIMRKEFARFFKDPRLVLGTLILPGLLIFFVYTLLGSVFYEKEPSYTLKIVNPSASFAALFEEQDAYTLEEAEASQVEAIKGEIKEGKTDLLIVFPENFDAILVGGAYAPPGEEGSPNVEVWYDSAQMRSATAYNTVAGLLDTLEDMVSSRFDVNLSGGGDLSTKAEAEASYYAMLLPFLVLTFLFSGCLGIAPESIAGEKERGTIATLLVTPIRRSELVIGKICSLSVLSALSAISSFIGTFLAMPKLMGGNIGDMFAAYTAGDYLALFAVMLSAVLLIVCIISILSAYAKSVKEATAFAMPVMVVVMLLGLSSMIFGTVKNPAAFLIPAYNCVQMMSQIFSRALSPVCLVITLASNAVYIGLLVFALTKMFKSEKCMFNN